MAATFQRHCSQCGLPIPESDLGSRCPNCLLELALTPEPDETGAETGLPQAMPSKSRFFGDYEFLGEIARGGMGVVYRARQISLNRVVALKLIHAAHLSSTDARLRFQMEVQTVAQLAHSNIVPLYAAGEHDGQPYFSMGLMSGGSLAERIRTGEFGDAARQAALLLAKVTRAVHHAHQRGILHRDLKPSNILLDERGEPHVSDFGLAKVLQRDSGLTGTESVVGSPSYMAPEQAAGHSHAVTIAADIYSLGAILYEMLTGRPPFVAGTALETMRLVVEQGPTPLRKLNPRLEADLETICLKCLQKNPAARYGTAEELAEDLERWLNGLPIRARPVGPLGSVWFWSKRHPAVALLGSALVLSVIGIAVGTSIAAVRIGRAERNAMANLRESLLGQARVLRLSGEMGRRSEGLRLIRQAASLGGLLDFRQRARNELLATLALTDMQFAAQPQLPGPLDPALAVFDALFERHASVVDGSTIVLRAVADGSEVSQFATGGALVTRVEEFSPDGRFLMLRHREGVSLWNTQTGERLFATNGPGRRFCFGPKLPWLALDEGPDVVSLRELPSLREINRFVIAPDRTNNRPGGWQALALSPNSRWLAAVRAEDRVVALLNLKTGDVQWRLTNNATVLALAWHPGNLRLAAAAADGGVVLWDPLNGRKMGQTTLPASVRSLVFNPTGTLLATACEDRAIRLLGYAAARLVFESPCDAIRLAFSADGQRLGLGVRGDAVGWLELARSSEFCEFTMASGMRSIEQCQFSYDDSMVGGASAYGLALYDPSSGKPAGGLMYRRPASFCFDPGGGIVLGADTAGIGRWAVRGTAPAVQPKAREHVMSGAGWRALAFSANGDWFVAANTLSNAAFVFDRTLTNQLALLGPHPAVNAVAISPDGRWVATGSSEDRHLKVWDTRDGREQLSLGAGGFPRAAFSPDGRWLASFGETFELRETGSWKPAPPLPFPEGRPLLGAAAFSRDSRLLAIVSDQSDVELFDLERFEPLGTLHPPSSVPINGLAFSHTGTRLAAACDRGRLRIWDLRQIRQRLAESGLDWDLPLTPATAPPVTATDRVRAPR